MSTPHQSPERIERSIIRKIGRVRFAQLKECLAEGVSVAFLIEEFGLDPQQVQYIAHEEQHKSIPLRTMRTR